MVPASHLGKQQQIAEWFAIEQETSRNSTQLQYENLNAGNRKGATLFIFFRDYPYFTTNI
jgi:hypothetical protein